MRKDVEGFRAKSAKGAMCREGNCRLFQTARRRREEAVSRILRSASSCRRYTAIRALCANGLSNSLSFAPFVAFARNFLKIELHGSGYTERFSCSGAGALLPKSNYD
jgi:hypothetical protein